MSSPTQGLKGLGDLARQPIAEFRKEADEYRHGEDRPIGGYATILSVYGVSAVVLAWVVRRRGGLPDRVAAGDLATLGLATHKLSRLITKDPVTSLARVPFTSYSEPAGNGELHEEVRGDGLRHAVGELVTCPFCVAMWVATAFAFGLVLAPRATRLAAGVLTVVTASDFLQLAYALLQRVATDDSN